MPCLSASAVVIHYEEALYHVYVPSLSLSFIAIITLATISSHFWSPNEEPQRPVCSTAVRPGALCLSLSLSLSLWCEGHLPDTVKRQVRDGERRRGGGAAVAVGGRRVPGRAVVVDGTGRRRGVVTTGDTAGQAPQRAAPVTLRVLQHSPEQPIDRPRAAVNKQ